MNPDNIIDEDFFDLQIERPDFGVILEESRKEKKFIDVQLQVGDQLFDAHRMVLAAYSPVLEALVSDQLSASKVCPISDEYVDPNIVEDLLHFLYTGSIQLTPDNIHPVCVAADYLQIPTLLGPAIERLGRLISIDNVLTVFKFNVAWKLNRLHYNNNYHCSKFIIFNHEQVFQDPQILEFSNEIFNQLIAGLRYQNRPETKLKESTFDCIVRWTEAKLSERLDELPVLLKNIPLEDLPLDFLTTTVSNHPLVKESISCIETVSAALEKIEPESSDNLVILSRDGESMSCCDSNRVSELLESDLEVWRKLPKMIKPRLQFAATVVNRKDIVVCGGTSNGEALDTVEMFEWVSQSWKQLPKMPFPSARCSIAELDGQLYVTGKKATESNEVPCYSFETQQWQYVNPMNNARRGAKLIEYDGYLYVFGGGTHVIEQYDPHSNEWTCIDATIPKAMRDETFEHLAVHEDNIYFSGKDYIAYFDPETTNSWVQIGRETRGGSIVSANERLLLAEDGNECLDEFCLITQQRIGFIKKNFSQNCFLFAGRFY